MEELRSVFYTGNYSRAQVLSRSLLRPDSDDFVEVLVIFWKSACFSDVSGAEVMATISSLSGNNNSPCLALLKSTLMHWARAIAEKGSASDNASSNLYGNFMQVGEQGAQQDLAMVEREWILLLVVEGLMLLRRDDDAFLFLKQLKASNLNG